MEKTRMANRQASRPELAALAALLGLGRSGMSSSLGDALGMGDARLGGVLRVGPEGVQMLSIEDVLGGNDGVEEFRSNLMGKQMSECEFGDYAPQTYEWAKLVGDVAHFATTVRNTDGDDEVDVHAWVLANLEVDEDDDSTDRWLLWSLCPRARHATVVPLRAADEARAKYLAGIVLDVMTGHLDGDDLAKMLRDGRPRKAKRAKAPATPV
jgi:hypothetical protein